MIRGQNTNGFIRLLAVLLALVLVLGISPIPHKTASAEGEVATIKVVDPAGDGLGEATVAYTIKDGSGTEEVEVSKGTVYTISDSTEGTVGTVTIPLTLPTEAGVEYTLTVTVSKDDYMAKGATEGEWKNNAVLQADLTSTTTGFDLSDVTLYPTITDVTVTPANETGKIVYSGGQRPLVTVAGALNTDTVTYKIGDGEYATLDDTVVWPTDVGTYVVTVKVTRPNHADFIQTHTLEITKAALDIEGLDIAPKSLTYNGENQILFDVDGDEDFELIWREGAAETGDGITTYPTGKDVGEYKYTVEVCKDDNHGTEFITVTAVIEAADQQWNFNSAAPDDDAAFTLDAVGTPDYSIEKYVDANGNSYFSNTAAGAITYTVAYTTDITKPTTVDIANAASFSDDGKLTINQPGSYTITVKVAGNANLNEYTVTRGIKVTQVLTENPLSFEGEPVSYTLGINGGVVSNRTFDLPIGSSIQGGLVEYSIDKTDIGLAIDSSGRLWVSNYSLISTAMINAGGSVTVTVTATLSDEYYTDADGKAFTASYNATISFASAAGYTAPDTSPDIWYQSVKIEPEEGYAIGEDIDNLSTNDIDLVAEGRVSCEFFTQNSDGGIAYVVLTYNIDNTVPVITSIAAGDTELLDTIAQNLSMGFFNPNVTITFTATDVSKTDAETPIITSGVEKFVWSYARAEDASLINELALSGELVDITTNADGSFSATVTIPLGEALQLKGTIAVYAVDKAGNYNEEAAAKSVLIVVDSIAPEVSVTYTQASVTVGNDDGRILYYNTENMTATFTVKEANFDEENVVVTVTKNEVDYDIDSLLTWSAHENEADTYVGTLTLSEEGDYHIKVEYTDRSGNAMQTYTSPQITIDKTAPVIELSTLHNPADGTPEQGTQFTIKDKNFDPDKVEWVLSAVDISGNDLGTLTSDGTSSGSLNSMVIEWQESEDTYTFENKFYINGIYTLTMNCTDKSGNGAGAHVLEFTIDHGTPTDLSIEYSESHTVSDILGNILFYSANKTATLTFIAYDDTTAVKAFNWKYTKTDGASDINASDLEGEITEKIETEEVVEEGIKKTKYTAELKLPIAEAQQLHGGITFTATDTYNNTSDPMDADGKTVVVDTIAPEVTVTYSATSNLVEEPNRTLYYNDDMTATFTVKEANFYEENVGVAVTLEGADYNIDGRLA